MTTKTSSTTSYSRAGSPSIDELLEDLKSSVDIPPTYPDDTVNHPQTAGVPPALSPLHVDPMWAILTNPEEAAKPDDSDGEKTEPPPPPPEYITLTRTMGHPHAFDSNVSEASVSPCIQWGPDLAYKPSVAADEYFVVNSGTPSAVEGYQDVFSIPLPRKRKAAEEDVADTVTRKNQRADKRSSRRQTTARAPSPAVKRSTPQPAATRKATPTPAPTAASSRQTTPRPQTSQKSAAAGPSASVPVRQTRWTTKAEKSLMNMTEA